MISVIFNCHAQHRVGIVNLLKAFFPEEAVQEEQREHAGVPCRFTLRVEEHALVIIRPGKDDLKSRMFLLTGFDVEDKALICRTLYEMLSRGTGKTLKWGILTESGVLSVAERMVATGWSDPEALSLCKRKYFISEEKMLLMLSIARQKKLHPDSTEAVRMEYPADTRSPVRTKNGKACAPCFVDIEMRGSVLYEILAYSEVPD